MQNPEAVVHRFSEEEYWAREETATRKHEFWNGEIVAMSGNTFDHARIAANIVCSVGNALEGKPCVVVGSDVRVRIAKSAQSFNTYPDISITCPPFEFEARRSGVLDTLLNPRVIMEVLSPSTSEFDQNEKFDQYKLLDSLTDYVLVWSERLRVKWYHRTAQGDWIELAFQAREAEIRLDSVDVSLSVDDIYRGLEISPDAQLRLWDENEGG